VLKLTDDNPCIHDLDVCVSPAAPALSLNTTSTRGVLLYWVLVKVFLGLGSHIGLFALWPWTRVTRPFSSQKSWLRPSICPDLVTKLLIIGRYFARYCIVSFIFAELSFVFNNCCCSFHRIISTIAGYVSMKISIAYLPTIVCLRRKGRDGRYYWLQCVKCQLHRTQ